MIIPQFAIVMARGGDAKFTNPAFSRLADLGKCWSEEVLVMYPDAFAPALLNLGELGIKLSDGAGVM